MTDKVSIIMPNYNGEGFIKETIESVICQTYTDWELLIVDDCSTDNSVEIIKSYCDSDDRIKLYINDTNCGAAHSRNVALLNANGRYIAFLDSDDMWLPEKLSRQISFMKDNGYMFSYTAYEHIDENNNSLNTVVKGPKKVNKRKMFNYCYPGCLTVMYDCSDIGVIQIPDEIANGENDYAIWLKVVKSCSCYFLPEILSLYRIRNSSLSHRSGLPRLIKNHYKLFRISENKSAIGALFSVIRNIFFGVWKKTVYVKRFIKVSKDGNE